MLLIGLIAGVYAQRDVLRSQLARFSSRPSPKPGGGFAQGIMYFGDFYGDAPWALSALPECFEQTQRVNGTPAYVDAQMPGGLQHVRPGERLSVADCAIVVRSNDVLVRRGKDRFHIPPLAALYRKGAELVLFRAKAGGAELRVYRSSNRNRTP